METDSIRSAKTRMRRSVVDRLLAMDSEDRRRQETELERRFPTLPGFETARTVLLYVSHLPEEFETRGVIRLALDQGKQVVCPRVDRQGRRLRLFEVRDLATDLVPGPFGIPEPKPEAVEISPGQVDWALIPGIAFDGAGFRLGRGAGYYDRLLPHLKRDAPRLALLLEPQWVEAIPREPHDQPVDGLVSGHRCWLPPVPPRRAGE